MPTGGARRGSQRPFSSHCLTGVKADVFFQCLTTLVMGGNALCRPGGNLGFWVWVSANEYLKQKPQAEN